MAHPPVQITTDAQLLDRVASIGDAWDEYIHTKIKWTPEVHNHVYASSIGDCALRNLRDMLEPEVRPPFDVDAKHRLSLGRDREREVLADLSRVGRDHEPSFTLDQQQVKIDVKGRWDKRLKDVTVARCKIEGVISWDDTRETWPFEVKSWSPFLVEKVETFADLFVNQWTRRGARQLLIYMYAKGKPRGLFILDRRGKPRLLPVLLEDWLEEVEHALQLCEYAVAGRLKWEEDGAPKDLLERDLSVYVPHATDPTMCASCDYFGKTCTPPMMSDGSDMLKVIDDPELEASLEQHQELAPAAREYKRLHDTVKKRFHQAKNVLCGPFLVTGKWASGTHYEYPEKVLARRTKEDEKYKTKVQEGSWRVKVVRVGESNDESA